MVPAMLAGTLLFVNPPAGASTAPAPAGSSVPHPPNAHQQVPSPGAPGAPPVPPPPGAGIAPRPAPPALGQGIPGTWTPLGPAPVNNNYDGGNSSGRVAALAVDPTSSTTVYAGTAGGGVWKTTDGGSNWTPLTDTQPSLAIGSLAIVPSNHLTVYAGTGEANNSGDSQYGEGVLKSTDGGTTWSVAGNSGSLFSGHYIGAVAVNPATPTTLFAATSVGLYKSTDAGTTWTSVGSLPGSSDVNQVVIDPVNPSTVYAATHTCSSDIYKSTDGGSTWTAIGPTGLSSPNRIALALAPSNHMRLYANYSSCTTSSELDGFRTDDGGATWTDLHVPSSVGGDWYRNAIAVDPMNASTAFFDGFEVWKTTNSGQTFTNVTDTTGNWAQDPVHVDQHALAFAPGASSPLYLGSDGGVWKTTDGGATYANLNTNLSTAQAYYGVAHSSTLALAGLQDNGTVQYTGAAGWPEVYGGDGGDVAIDPNTPTTIYQEYVGLDIHKSTDGGQSWASTTNGIDRSHAAFIAPFTMDPSNSQVLVAGTNQVYRTTDGANNWSAISPVLTANSLSAVTVAPTSSSEIWAGSLYDGKVWVTTDGATWTDRSAGLPGWTVTSIAVDPTTPQHAYVSIGCNCWWFGHVFETTDLGASWADVTGAFPNVAVNSLAFDGSSGLFAATDRGVYVRTSGAWGVVGSGLPNAQVMDIRASQDGTFLLASTHGRGMWKMPLPDLTITKHHTGNFTRGQVGATYTIHVSNTGTLPTTGTVSVVDTLPTGLTATGLTGSGWSCTVASKTCTRSDALAASAAYPDITVTVNVASTAPPSVTNKATVSGGGETNTANDTASDPTTIT